MKSKFTVSDVVTLVMIFFVGLFIAIILYPFLHEVGHLLAAYCVGADIIEFEILPMPHIMCGVHFLSPIQNFLIGISGMITPYIIGLIMPPKWFWSWYVRFILLGISLLSFTISLMTAVIPNGNTLNQTDDIVQLMKIVPISRGVAVVFLLFIMLTALIFILKDRPFRVICKRFGI